MVINGSICWAAATRPAPRPCSFRCQLDLRKDAPAAAVARDIAAKGSQLREGITIAFSPAAIRGLGTSGGFEMYLQATADPDPARLYQMTQTFLQALREHPQLTAVNSFFRPTVPQLRVEVDREKAFPGCRCRKCSRRCRAPWARCTSTTSTSSAAPTACR
jgi:multidrug efflux pump subunit AcrB